MDNFNWIIARDMPAQAAYQAFDLTEVLETTGLFECKRLKQHMNYFQFLDK